MGSDLESPVQNEPGLCKIGGSEQKRKGIGAEILEVNKKWADLIHHPISR
jgi:hypothetical protein